MKKAYLLLLPLLMLLACSDYQSEELRIQSPEGTRSLFLKGHKETIAGPITINIYTDAVPAEKAVAIELEAEELTLDQVKVNWTNEQEGVMYLTRRDDTKKEYEFILTDSSLKFVQVGGFY